MGQKNEITPSRGEEFDVNALKDMPDKLYLIALIPPEPLREQIKVLKEEMKDRFQSAHALKSPAHITLRMPLRLPPKKETRLVSLLKQLAGAQKPFPVKLQGFDSFPPRVIFIRIEDHKPITALMEQLEVVLTEEFSFGIGDDHHPFHPHLTIAARDLKEAAFHQAWTEFKVRPFKATFEAHSLFLLKHNGRFWEIYCEFNFGGGS